MIKKHQVPLQGGGLLDHEAEWYWAFSIIDDLFAEEEARKVALAKAREMLEQMI